MWLCVCGGGRNCMPLPIHLRLLNATRLYTPLCRSIHLLVRASVRLSVRLSHFTFFLLSLASLLLSKWSSDLKYSPCPPTCDWGSRVSDLVFLSKELVVIWHQTCTMGCTCLRTRYNREYLKILKRLKMYNFKYISIILISFVYMKKNKYHDFIRF